ncbi:MAG TPA: cob(I)yrinic acid a,c-diamide adenosyltransferase [Thermoplasmata archaeon]|nr:cob(I)yrinic acid a,c-diamide adenosyltransferase [Thermoplasmata archaeon]
MENGGPRPTRVYTRTGDEGETGLVGGHRLRKASPRIQAFGDLDELGAHLGLVASTLDPQDDQLVPLLGRLQHELFIAQSELAVAPGAAPPTHRLGERHVRAAEEAIDRLSADLDPVRSFVLPRGGRTGAELHVARAVARRAERSVLALHAVEPVARDLRVWLNRVSDLLFVAALWANRRDGFAETPPDYTT